MIYDPSQASQITTVKNQAAADPTSSSSTSGTINGGVSRLADNEQTFLKLFIGEGFRKHSEGAHSILVKHFKGRILRSMIVKVQYEFYIGGICRR